MVNDKRKTVSELNEIYGKIPPQCVDIEKSVLGTLINYGHDFYKVANILDVDCFYRDSNQKIFKAIKQLYEKNEPIDFLILINKLKADNTLDEVGGGVYVAELQSAQSYNLVKHSLIVRQKHMQRELIRIGSQLTNDSYDENADIEELLTNLRTNISLIEDFSTFDGKSQREVLRKTIEELEKDVKEREKGGTPGINTGVGMLNSATGGWRNSNFIVLAARPGVGKTSLALHFAKEASSRGFWVNFYGLEMPSHDLMRIMLSGESGVSRSSLRDGDIIDFDWDKINSAVTALESLKILWYDYADITSGQIRANTIKNRKNDKCHIVIIDYIQLVTPTDNKVVREQQISEISRTLKKLALSENVPVMALAQLNREADRTGKPMLSHIRESGSLEQDADIVIAPWWNNSTDENRGEFTLSVLKNRRGIKGDIPINVNEEMTAFYDSAKNEYTDAF